MSSYNLIISSFDFEDVLDILTDIQDFQEEHEDLCYGSLNYISREEIYEIKILHNALSDIYDDIEVDDDGYIVEKDVTIDLLKIFPDGIYSSTMERLRRYRNNNVIEEICDIMAPITYLDFDEFSEHFHSNLFDGYGQYFLDGMSIGNTEANIQIAAYTDAYDIDSIFNKDPNSSIPYSEIEEYIHDHFDHDAYNDDVLNILYNAYINDECTLDDEDEYFTWYGYDELVEKHRSTFEQNLKDGKIRIPNIIPD